MFASISAVARHRTSGRPNTLVFTLVFTLEFAECKLNEVETQNKWVRLEIGAESLICEM